MILDSSAIVAVLRREPEGETFRQMLADQPSRVSAATLVETSIVIGHHRVDDLRALLDAAATEVVDFSAEHWLAAIQGHQRFGKGSGSPARLNLGDCFSYALAKVTGEPLLFKGDDFRHTDVEAAL